MSFIHNRHQTIVALRIAKDAKSFMTFRRILQFQEYLISGFYSFKGAKYKKFQVKLPT